MKPVTTSVSPSGHRISTPSQTRDFSAPRKLVAARTSDEYAPVPTRFKPAILPQSGNSPLRDSGKAAGESGNFRHGARQQIFASWFESLGAFGVVVIRIRRFGLSAFQ